MFKISTIAQTFLHPVSVDVRGDNGKTTTHKFKLQFKRKTQDELDELYRRMTPAKLNEGEQQLSDDELLDEVVVGWQDVLDEQDRPLDFNPDNFKALKNIYPARPTMVQAFFDSMKVARRGN